MKKDRIFWGILLIIASIVLIAGRLNYFPEINVFTALLSVFLVITIIKSILKLNFYGILFPIAFICIMYDKQLGIEAATPGPVLLAALLGSVGLSMLFDRHNFNFHKKFNRDNFSRETIYEENEGNIILQASFGESIKYVNTDKFESAELDCSFGSMKIYFDNAQMLNESAVINLQASFSGVEIYIPKNWKISNETKLFAAAIDEKNRNDVDTTNTLIITGNLSFAGVEIVYI